MLAPASTQARASAAISSAVKGTDGVCSREVAIPVSAALMISGRQSVSGWAGYGNASRAITREATGAAASAVP